MVPVRPVVVTELGSVLRTVSLLILTNNQRNWGFGSCFLYLRNMKGYPWNHKRVYCIYRELEIESLDQTEEAD